MDGYWFGVKAKSVNVIFAILLKKAFGNKTCFIFLDNAIGFLFDSEDPFASN